MEISPSPSVALDRIMHGQHADYLQVSFVWIVDRISLAFLQLPILPCGTFLFPFLLLLE